MRNTFSALPKKGKKTLSRHATAKYYHFTLTYNDFGFAFQVQAGVSTASTETLLLCTTSKTQTKTAEKGLLQTNTLMRRHKTGTTNDLFLLCHQNRHSASQAKPIHQCEPHSRSGTFQMGSTEIHHSVNT